MTMTYRTRRRLQTIGTIGSILLLVIIAVWLCWVVWLERYVVYTRDNEAILDLEFNANDMIGEVARPPASGGTGISIYYNEGDNAVELTNELTQLNGYYIDSDMLIDDMTGIWDSLALLPSGTPIMVELKAGYGSFYYSSGLADAVQSQSVNVTEVDLLIQELNNRGYYTIAKVSAFRDYNFGLNHVNHGLPVAGKQYLWSDDGGCYWLNPTSETTINWITSVIQELQNKGFKEVVLADFRFPAGEKYSFNGDKNEALEKAAKKLLSVTAKPTFTLSFCVDNAAFPLEEGRSRLYLQDVGASNIGAKASQATVSDPSIRLVFLSENNDTRYNDFGILRPIYLASIIEEQKAAQAEE